MKEVGLNENVNCIKDIAEGKYRIVLDFTTTGILKYLLRDSYKYVWVNNHVTESAFKWKQYNLPVKEGKNLKMC